MYNDNILCSKVTDKPLQIYTHSHTRTDGGRVASLSCTFNRARLNGENSVAAEKGTLNPQCVYKRNASHWQVYGGSENEEQRTVNFHFLRTKRTKVTSVQNTSGASFFFFFFLAVQLLRLALPAESNHRVTQSTSSCTPTSCTPTTLPKYLMHTFQTKPNQPFCPFPPLPVNMATWQHPNKNVTFYNPRAVHLKIYVPPVKMFNTFRKVSSLI